MSLRRAVAVLVAILGLGLAYVVAAPDATAATFSDVQSDTPFAGDIEWLAENRIASGNADGTFRPDAPVTRQAMAVFLYHFAHGGDAPAPCSSTVLGVDAESVYCGSILWLVQQGITNGTSSGGFDPLGPVTRESMAAFLYHLDHNGAAPAACQWDAYQDVPMSSPFCPSIAWLYAEGITTNTPDGNFGPRQSVTRGMMAAFLHHYDTALHAVVGFDVSHDKCLSDGSTSTRPLPTGQAFGIIGVNGGKATTFNTCMAAQLAWAGSTTGRTAQPKVQVYVNTGNPGDVTPRVASWPTSGSSTRYHSCTGTNTAACAYVYGRERAAADVAKVSHPENYVWWLDVETGNSWSSAAVSGGTIRNVAVLEGMTDYFTSIGIAKVGLYSTSYQWGVITGGSVSSTSPLNGLSSWLAGATGTASAARKCDEPPLTTGGDVVMTQYVDGGFDRDHSCV